MRTIAQSAVHSPSRLRDYVTLCKPRISLMVILTVFVGGLLSGAGGQIGLLVNTALGVLLIAASGCAINQYLERYTDFLMFRTSRRPLPGGRLSATEVVVFAAVTFGIGVAVMIMLTNWLVTVLGITTWVLYNWIYTPLKLHTVYNTMIGAIPGAMPILIGAAASEQGISASAWSFFFVLLIWQFPHFMSIAWLYRKDYADGDIKMITVTDPSGYWAGVWAVGFGILLLPVSVIPAWMTGSLAGFWLLNLGGLGLGFWFLRHSFLFARAIRQSRPASKPSEISRGDEIARQLLRVSLMYLPLYMLILIIATFI